MVLRPRRRAGLSAKGSRSSSDQRNDRHECVQLLTLLASLIVAAMRATRVRHRGRCPTPGSLAGKLGTALLNLSHRVHHLVVIQTTQPSELGLLFPEAARDHLHGLADGHGHVLTLAPHPDRAGRLSQASQHLPTLQCARPALSIDRPAPAARAALASVLGRC